MALSEKERFYCELQTTIQTFEEQIARKLTELIKAYFDNGFNNGGADAIIDADLTAVSSNTAADVALGWTFLDDMRKFLGNEAVTTADRQATISKLIFARK
jgi:hypothetical protein